LEQFWEGFDEVGRKPSKPPGCLNRRLLLWTAMIVSEQPRPLKSIRDRRGGQKAAGARRGNVLAAIMAVRLERLITAL
jgi:hypothetical protein